MLSLLVPYVLAQTILAHAPIPQPLRELAPASNSNFVQAANPTNTTDPLVTYHGEAQNILTALSALAIAANSTVKYHVSDTLKNDVIVIDVTQVPLSQVLQRIATVESAKWTNEGASSYLTQDDDAVSRQDNLYYTAEALKLQKALEKPIAPPIKGGPPQYDLSAMGSDDAYTRKLLLEIGPLNIVSIKKDQRVVFSNHPNSVQIAFPDGSEELVDRIALKAKANQMETFGGNMTMAIPSHLAPDKISKEPVAKVDLVLSTPTAFMGITSSAFVRMNAKVIDYDAQGKVIGETQISIPSYDGPSSLARMMAKLDNAGKPKPIKADSGVLSQPIKLTGVPAEYTAAVTSSHQASMMGKGGDIEALLPYVLDPVKYEPLIVPGALASATADAYHLNLVANIPDSMYDMVGLFGFGEKEFPSPASESASLRNRTDIQVVQNGNWMTIAPSLPDVSQHDRVSRTYLETADQYFHTHSAYSVSSFAQMAVEFHGQIGQIADPYLNTANPGLALDLQTQNWKLLQLYGLLPDEERMILDKGGKVPYSSIPGDAAQVAEALVYGADEQLYTDQISKVKKSNPFEDMSAMFGGPSLNSAKGYQSEPTEVAPNGIPANASLVGSITKSIVYHAQLDPKAAPQIAIAMGKMALTPQMVGMFMAITKMPEMQGQTEMPKFTGLTQGNRTSLTLKLYIAPSTYAGGTIHQDSFATGAPSYTMNNLPADIKTEMAKMTKMFSKFSGSPGSATNSGAGP